MTARHDLYCFIQGVSRVTYTMIYCNIIVSFDKLFIDYNVYLCPKPLDYYIKTSIDPYICNQSSEREGFISGVTFSFRSLCFFSVSFLFCQTKFCTLILLCVTTTRC